MSRYSAEQVMLDSLVSVRQVAERLGLSRQRIHQFIADGRLTAAQGPRYWLVDPTSVEELARQRAKERKEVQK